LCSSDKARRILNYKTSVDLRTGLTRLVDWIKEQGAREFSYHLPVEIVNEKTPETWTKKLF
jgi:UDP-glucose 4-epimerase